MNNNAYIGFSFQNLICKKYNIVPNSMQAVNQFNSAYDKNLDDIINPVIDEIFTGLQLQPIECTTFDVDDDKKIQPYNFILSDNSTLSIRTNFNGNKVAPRIVGQAGFEKLNKYFGEIYGKKICSQDDIKHLILNYIDKCLPIFFNFLFDADYILWIFQEGSSIKYHLIKGDSGIDIQYDKDKFLFTRYYDDWNESTTLKYNGKSIAEIQVHKNRSFKFRFLMKNVLPLIIDKEKNNETLGITAEKTICDIFNLKCPPNFIKRYSPEMQYQMADCINYAFTFIPKPIAHSGSSVGIRGGASKCSYDFVLYGNKTLSLKTNIGKMVCPPEVGQPNDKTCYLYFKQFICENHIDGLIFKQMVFDHIDEMLPIYISHMFDSDYLLRIFVDKENAKITGCPFNFEIFEKNLGSNFVWNKKLISFSKMTLDDWNESNTLYYDSISIGEFQVHKNRNCYKFRFNFSNLIRVLHRYS